MFSHFAYGLGIHSAFALPELVAAEAPCDVIVRWEDGQDACADAGDEQWYARLAPAEGMLFVKDVGLFRVRDGREVAVTRAPGVDEDLIRLYLLGTVMAMLLYQRGLLVLHASTVAIDGGAVAFMGESGRGKSSLAAALHDRGHAVVADDLTPVDLCAGVALAIPGFPQLKLYAEVADALGRDRESLRLLHPQLEKRGWRVTSGFSTTRLPLTCVYILGEDQVSTIEPIRPSETVIELVCHSYPTRLQHSAGAAHFRQTAHLARAVPAYRLKRPCSLATLPALAELVEEHVAGLRTTGPQSASDTDE
jgi:hypothetical protein